MKPQLLKNKAISKQYDFDLFGSDEEDNWTNCLYIIALFDINDYYIYPLKFKLN